MPSLLRVLIVDDSEDDASLIIRKLHSGDYDPQYERVDTPEAMKSALEKQEWDVILCDYKMPCFSAIAALKIAQEKNVDIPFIIVSGAVGEDVAVSTVKSGAHDYVMKDNLTKLPVTIDRAIREANIRREKINAERMLELSKENFRHSLDNSPLGVRIVTADGDLIYTNQEMLNIYGYDSIEDLRTTPHEKRYTPESLAEYQIRKAKRLRGEYVPSRYEISIVRKDGRIRDLEVFRKQVLWNGELQYQSLYSDITRRKQAEKNLRDSEERYRDVVENAHESIVITQGMKVVFANRAAADNTGYSIESLKTGLFTNLIHPDDIKLVSDYHLKRLNGEDVPSVYSFRIICKDGTIKWVELSATIIQWEKEPATLNFLKDITERKLLDEERNENYKKTRETLDATVNSIAMIVETRDPYTTGHQLRVSHLARDIAIQMGLSGDEREFITTAAIIHDIGKLSIPSEILSKPTKLTALEFELIKTHSQSGYNILKDIKFPWPVATVILQHHERINGTGYPHKLKGDEILLESRIVSVADVVEAISSHRPYRPTLGINFALDEITKNRGILYDANVVDYCIKLLNDKTYTFS
jgi:PAS domain S-box-containing protein/putative nucleotidyltransferase with HDIG domain